MQEVICPKCGKRFIPAPEHRYRDGHGTWCTWTCYLHRYDGKKTKSKVRKVEVYDEDGELLRTFDSVNEVADQLGFPEQCVMDACRKGKLYQGCYWKYKD